MAQGIRSFIAISISDEVKQAVGQAIGEWQRLPGDVRWTPPSNMHLTLKFLGDVALEQVEEVRAGAARAVAGIAPFTLEFGLLGAFPSWRRPRVLWIGAALPPQAAALHAALDRELAALGFPPEDRPFSPHLTLARVKQPFGLEPLTSRLQARRAVACPPLAVDRITLYKSDLRPAGPVYTSLHSFAFSVEDNNG